jgi:hypothetical protein
MAGSLTEAVGFRDHAHLWTDESQERLRVVMEDGYTYADLSVPLLGQSVTHNHAGDLPLDFLTALRFGEEAAYLHVAGNRLQVHCPDRWYAYTSLASFDSHKLFIPTANNTTNVKVSRKELTAAIKSVAPSDGFGRVTITSRAGSITVASGEASIDMAAQSDGPGGSITFSSVKFLRITDALGGADVEFGFNVVGLAPIEFKERSIECQVFLAPVVT